MSAPSTARAATVRHSRGSDSPVSRAGDVRWGSVLVAVTGAFLLAMVGVGLSVAVYALVLGVQGRGDVDVQAIDTFAEAAGDAGGRPLSMLLLLPFGAWAAARARSAPRKHGLFVGLGGALVGVVLDLASDELRALPSIASAFGCVAFGLLGGAWASALLEARACERRLSQGVERATSIPAMVVALGEALRARGAVFAGLRRADGGTVAAWSAAEEPAPPPASAVDALMEELTSSAPSVSRGEAGGHEPRRWTARRTSRAGRERWEALGWRSLFVLPLVPVRADRARRPLRAGEDAEPPERLDLLVACGGADGARHELSRGDRRRLLALAPQLRLALENLRLVARSRAAGVLEERRRLAHDIHDTLAQGFAGIALHLEAAEPALEGAGPAVREHLQEARDVARESLARAREIVWALRPDTGERPPLEDAVRGLTERFAADSGVDARFEATGEPRRLGPEVEALVTRAAQEAVANCRKHARAKRVSVTLSYMDDVVVLDVRDDGVGFAAEDPGGPLAGSLAALGGFGLDSMRQGVRTLGGRLAVETSAGEGTAVVVEVPARPFDPSDSGEPEPRECGDA